MIPRVGRGLQLAAASVLLAAYTGLSHYCNTHGVGGLGAVLALAPPLVIGLGLLWRSAPPWIAGSLTVAAALLLYYWWPQLEKKFSMVYLLQECGMYGLLAFGFGRTLGPGDTALCTRLADRLHGPLTPRELRYTRRVTAAWAIFFAALTLAILSLYLLAPLAIWSLFVNFIALPLVALMFVAEYAVRRQALPETRRSGILASVRIFLSSR
ncbi:MAG TPA: hypothetical protein VK715_06980 [Steroidobacteraceae bacterium]|nr:hypothetical protein [Steroidobacteraceae bacterium]